jgi:hypothetical protein
MRDRSRLARHDLNVGVNRPVAAVADVSTTILSHGPVLKIKVRRLVLVGLLFFCF